MGGGGLQHNIRKYFSRKLHRLRSFRKGDTKCLEGFKLKLVVPCGMLQREF